MIPKQRSLLIRAGNSILGRSRVRLSKMRSHIFPLRVNSLSNMASGAFPQEASARGDVCLQTIINSLKDEVAIIGPDFRVRQVNTALLQRLGTTAGKVIGRPCFQVIHNSLYQCRSPWCACPLTQVLSTGKTERVLHTGWGEQGDDDRYQEVIVSPLLDGYGHANEIVEMARDITENKKLQKEILIANHELLVFNSICRTLNQSLELKPTLEEVTKTMLDALEVQVCWINLNGQGAPVWASNDMPTTVDEQFVKELSTIARRDQVVTDSHPLSFHNDRRNLVQETCHFAVAPLKAKGNLLGYTGIVVIKKPLNERCVQLLEAISNQISLAVDRCILHDEVELGRTQRGELLHRLISTEEEERKRIARELHDETAQTLTALKIGLEALAQGSSPDAGKSQVERLSKICEKIENDVEKLIYDLRPVFLDDLGIVEAVRFYSTTYLDPAGIKSNFSVTGMPRRLPDKQEMAIFRVVQESITNILKHARASNTEISLIFDEVQFTAEVKDDGRGYDTRQIGRAQPHRGLGLLGMEERMNLAGGTLYIKSESGKGTSVKAVLPLKGGL